MHRVVSTGEGKMEHIFFWFLFAAAVLGILGPIFWIVAVVWLMKPFWERKLNRTCQELEFTLSQAQSGGTSQRTEQQAQIAQMHMRNALEQLGRLDDRVRERYDVRMGQLRGMAASAGIEWLPGDPTTPGDY
jgi:hypothetical protein